jgi:hypothetical protein
MGEKIYLGNYSSEINWQNMNTTNEQLNFSTQNGVLFHEQYYDMGSICELNNKPRKTIVKVIYKE